MALKQTNKKLSKLLADSSKPSFTVNVPNPDPVLDNFNGEIHITNFESNK
jgi:hypothetical protein